MPPGLVCGLALQDLLGRCAWFRGPASDVGAWLPAEVVAKASESGLFMYAGRNETSFDRHDVGAERFRVELRPMAGAELYKNCFSQSDTKHYYTVDVAETPLRADAGKLARAFGVAPNQARLALWVGGRGSTTQAHYDVADNVLAQLVGTKRVRCWAAETHLAMCPFPDAHPRGRKAQAEIGDAEAAGPRGAPLIDVTLQPGDAVRIPAFCFHHVEAAERSVSLNCLMPSPVAQLAQELLMLPMPRAVDVALQSAPAPKTSADWIESRTGVLRSAYLDAAPLGDGTAAFARAVFESRYAPLAEAYAAIAPETLLDAVAPNPDAILSESFYVMRAVQMGPARRRRQRAGRGPTARALGCARKAGGPRRRRNRRRASPRALGHAAPQRRRPRL